MLSTHPMQVPTSSHLCGRVWCPNCMPAVCQQEGCWLNTNKNDDPSGLISLRKSCSKQTNKPSRAGTGKKSTNAPMESSFLVLRLKSQRGWGHVVKKERRRKSGGSWEDGHCSWVTSAFNQYWCHILFYQRSFWKQAPELAHWCLSGAGGWVEIGL